MNPHDEARARELFFQFDGSEFYMSRDGVDDEYRALKVPKNLRRKWMRELTVKHLAALHQQGNGRTIRFLSENWDYSHVREVLKARPLGDWWERVAFLEALLDYVRKARWLFKASGADRAAAARIALDYGPQLLFEAAQLDDEDFPGGTAADRRKRVEDVLSEARRHAR